MLAFVMLYLMPFDLAWVVVAPVRQLIGLKGSVVVDVLLVAIALRFAFNRDDDAQSAIAMGSPVTSSR